MNLSLSSRLRGARPPIVEAELKTGLRRVCCPSCSSSGSISLTKGATVAPTPNPCWLSSISGISFSLKPPFCLAFSANALYLIFNSSYFFLSVKRLALASLISRLRLSTVFLSCYMVASKSAFLRSLLFPSSLYLSICRFFMRRISKKRRAIYSGGVFICSSSSRYLSRSVAC